MSDDIFVDGFQFAAVKSGIRGKDRLDVGLIFCDHEAVAAAVFTNNIVKAAPVLLGKERLRNKRLQAVMINSGIANACTGDLGMENARKAAKMLADALGIDEDLVLVSSTGVIGEQFDMSCFEKAVPELAAGRSANSGQKVARAIMTTDTVPKIVCREVQISGKKVTIAGIAKGSGMIMPNMATMLGFVMTDASIEADILDLMLKNAVQTTFNKISVDGDSSTNDTVLVMASGMAGNDLVNSMESIDGEIFQKELTELCRELAFKIVVDGEGATKFVTLQIDGARTVEEADMAGRCVANSALVKTAFFGQDANWGRIIGALGRSGAQFDPAKVDICFDDVKMVKNGLGQGKEVEARATEVLKKDKFVVAIDLKNGNYSTQIYTCDFSIDYVKINADYRS